MDGQNGRIYEFGGFRLIPAEHLLVREDGAIVPLMPKGFEVLLMLVEQHGHLVEKDELLNRVWAGAFVEESNVARVVWTVRHALGDESNHPQFIETVPKCGYRFIADIRQIENGQAGQIETASEPAAEAAGASRQLSDVEEKPEKNLPPPKAVKTTTEKSNLQTALKAEHITARIKSRKTGVVLAMTVLLVAVVFFGYYFLNRRQAALNFQAGQTTRLTSSGRVNTAVISSDGKFVIYAQEEYDGRQSLWTQHVGSRSNVQIAPAADIEYRSLNIAPDGSWIYYSDGKGTIYQIPVLGGAAKKITGDLFKDSQIGFSPDGRQFAFVRRFEKDASALFVINSDGANEQKLISFEQPFRLEADPSWSPDGEIIACPIIIEGLFKILAVRVADGTFKLFSSKNWSLIKKLAWLPDSKSLIFIGTVTANFHQLFQISYPEGEARQITSDLNNYNDFSLTADASSLATVRVEQAAHLWVTAGDDAARARQITSGFEKFDGIYSLDWMADGKLLYTSSPSDEISIWTIETGGGNPKLFVKDAHFSAVSPDASFIVYRKRFGSERALIRMNLRDGSETLLTKGTITYPTVSPDGKWLVFTRYDDRVALWKMPTEGGEPAQVLAENAVCSVVSPDGKTIAFVFKKGGQPNRIALVSADGGEIFKTFDAKLETNPLSNNQSLQWTADGRAISFISLADGVSNVWQQPIDGSAPPVRMTNFDSGRIFNFAFSPDGRQLALSRGTLNSDVVLIKNSE